MNHNDIKEIFYLSPKERRGTFYVLVIIIGLGFSNYMLEKYYNPKVRLSQEQLEEIHSAIEKRQINPTEESIPIIRQKSFDPNTVLKEELEAFGWPQYPIKNLIAYRNSGGKFKKKLDLKKIYGITDNLYIQIEEHIDILDDKKISHSIEPVAKKSNKETNEELILFNFNPNKLSVDSLLLLGWSRFAANNLNKYRKSGGIIKNKEDILEIYGMDSVLYKRIVPFIVIENEKIKLVEPITDRPEKTKNAPSSLNINTADSIGLLTLKGIGPYRANAIVKYRNRLGGFYHLNQLYEIYGLDSTTVVSIMPYLSIDQTYRRINIDGIEFKKLLAHPYTDYNMTVILKNYFKNRDQKEFIESFVRDAPVDSVKLNNLIPYLILNE